MNKSKKKKGTDWKKAIEISRKSELRRDAILLRYHLAEAGKLIDRLMSFNP